MKKLILLVVLLLPASAEIKVFKNFTLIDGTGNPAIASVAMMIDNGRITRIGSAQRTEVPEGAQVIDLDGKFVMPGIINLHGHSAIRWTSNKTRNFTRAKTSKRICARMLPTA